MFQGSVFECKAINNNVTKPPSSKVKITLEMPILSMTIANMEDPVTAGMVTVVEFYNVPGKIKLIFEFSILKGIFDMMLHKNLFHSKFFEIYTFCFQS